MSELLTLAQAANLLGVSRPTASLLCDAEKLGVVVVGENGQRLVPATAVRKYLKEREQLHQGAPTPREAGRDARLYDFPDEHYKNRVRIAPPAEAKQSDAASDNDVSPKEPGP